MHRAAESICEAEKRMGLDSRLAWTDTKDYQDAIFADVHVGHTFIPAEVWMQRPNVTVVWVAHATPEVVFQTAVEDGKKGGYGHGDAWMLIQYWLQHSDAVVTFWPRHHEIWKSLCDKRAIVKCIPLGIDKLFWNDKVPSQGKYVGNPSVLTCENNYSIKWPLDLFIAWPWVQKEVDGVRLHATNLPQDVHRWFFPLVNRNGASFSSYISATRFDHVNLRNALNSVDYYCGLVRYGDFNRMSLEAGSCKCKTISYEGNPYADFWVSEGDQRRLADELAQILKGDVEPRVKDPIPDIDETAKQMKELYDLLLSERKPNAHHHVHSHKEILRDKENWIESMVPKQRVSDGSSWKECIRGKIFGDRT
jgi:hypothetical protein